MPELCLGDGRRVYPYRYAAKPHYQQQFCHAQESFLSAQLSEAENIYDGAQAIIALYIALGGGTK